MRVTFSIFPKFYAHLDPHGLAALVREVGLDTTNAVIRDGYWITPGNIAEQLPAFVEILRREGLQVRLATAGFSPDQLLSDPAPLAIMADSGISDFRLSYFRLAGGDVRASMASARESLERLVPLCERYQIRALYQVHQGTLIASASAAWTLVNGLPSRWVGVELDPGNQAFEGFERWDRSAGLLGDYLVAMGIKDVSVSRDLEHASDPDKGYRRAWAPIDQGVTNWHDVAQALAAADFQGTLVFMPFYEENNPARMTELLRREVAYLRDIVAQYA